MSATAPYGPQTVEIRRFLQRFAALAPAQWAQATAAYDALQATPRFPAADRALASAVARTGRESLRDAALGPLVQLLELAPTHEPSDAAPAAPDAPAPLAPVAEAALAAVLALLVRDVLGATAFTTLYEPFATLIPVEVLSPTRATS